jgi:hypothetical protein
MILPKKKIKAMEENNTRIKNQIAQQLPFVLCAK